MKNKFKLISVVILMLLTSGSKYPRFTYDQEDIFSIDELYVYQKEYQTEDVGACSLGKTKTYMDYRAITDESSTQYKFIKANMEVDETTGFLIDKDGFIGVALGSYYGVIGDRYYFTLDTGVVLPLVKIDEKSDKDTDPSGCYHSQDGSVIEFVIDRDIANDFYGHYANGLVLQGNFSNYKAFKGNIAKVEKVLKEKNGKFITYVSSPLFIQDYNIFDYASGY